MEDILIDRRNPSLIRVWPKVERLQVDNGVPRNEWMRKTMDQVIVSMKMNRKITGTPLKFEIQVIEKYFTLG